MESMGLCRRRKRRNGFCAEFLKRRFGGIAFSFEKVSGNGGRDGEKVLAREPEPCANRTCLGLIAVSPESIHECLHGFRAIG